MTLIVSEKQTGQITMALRDGGRKRRGKKHPQKEEKKRKDNY